MNTIPISAGDLPVLVLGNPLRRDGLDRRHKIGRVAAWISIHERDAIRDAIAAARALGTPLTQSSFIRAAIRLTAEALVERTKACK